MKFCTKALLTALAAICFVLPVEAKKKKDKGNCAPVKSAYELFTGRDSVMMEGVMNVIRKGDSIFLEMPVSLVGREFLVVNRLQKVPKELNESGVNKGINYQNQTIRFDWDKKKRKITIRQQRVTPLVDKDDAMARSVKENYIDPVLAVIDVKMVGKDSATVIFPMEKMFNGRESCLNDVFHNINIAQNPDRDLSKIISVKSHERSVSATSEFTTVVHEGMDRVNVTVEVSSTLYLLDEIPMEGREQTPRIGYFTSNTLDYADNQLEVETRRFAQRWRLVPSDKEAYMKGQLVEPVKPITFYLDQRIPENVRPYIRKGILDWNAAFEKAGFKNAIRVENMTDSIEREEDDMRYSVVTYAASEKANAMGPSTVDPRSGEILEADIMWWHNVRRLLANWLTVQTGAINPAVRTPNIPEELMGDAIRFVATHEVGHSLGLRHNMRASAAFPTDSLRSKAFTDRVGGTSTSIMDYARFNYVAQPEDGVTTLSPHIGVYDMLAIEWGYRWFPSEKEGKQVLENLLKAHDSKEYMYAENTSYRDALDPRSLSEDLGDDNVKSSKYGLQNLKRLVPNLAEWTSTGDASQDWDAAAKLWQAVITQWDLYNYHVLANIGGLNLENTVRSDGKKTFAYVDKVRQKAAVQYIIDEVLKYPKWLYNPGIADYTYLLKNGREEHPSTSWKNEVNYILWDMLNNERLMRMCQNECEQGESKAFTALEMIEMLHKAVFVEAANPDMYQRAVQKSMVDALITAANEGEGIKVNKNLTDACFFCSENPDMELYARVRDISFTSKQITRISDPISIKRGELLRIRQFAKARIGACSTVQQMHYNDIVMRIETALGM